MIEVRELGNLSLGEIQQLVGEQTLALRAHTLRAQELESRLAETTPPAQLASVGIDMNEPVPAGTTPDQENQNG